MNLTTIFVSGANAHVKSLATIPAGIVGASVTFTFTDPLWDRLNKTVVFRGNVTKDVPLQGNTVKIPHETVERQGATLKVGVYGVDADGLLIIPTLWAVVGSIRDAADPSGDPGTDPSLPVWADLASRVENLEHRPIGSGIDVAGAVAGQTVKIAAVDDKGCPTVWEPADFPESGGNVDLAGYATEQYVKDYAQPKGNYLSEVPEGYAKSSEIPKKPEDIGALPNTYTPPNQTAAQVGADPAGTAASAVSQHNTANDSHGDIRLELKVINDRLTAFFDSDDQTLDELSEIVAYITSNKSLIDSITTSKVSVADIVNNLTTNVANKPLSAAQGVVLKGLIDAVSNNLANYQPKGDYLKSSELPTAVNNALAQAKANGEFDGTSITVTKVTESTADGGSNEVEFSDGKTLTVKNGSKGETGPQGPAYTLTSADKTTIVNAVMDALPTLTVTGIDADGVSHSWTMYGVAK